MHLVPVYCYCFQRVNITVCLQGCLKTLWKKKYCVVSLSWVENLKQIKKNPLQCPDNTCILARGSSSYSEWALSLQSEACMLASPEFQSFCFQGYKESALAALPLRWHPWKVLIGLTPARRSSWNLCTRAGSERMHRLENMWDRPKTLKVTNAACVEEMAKNVSFGHYFHPYPPRQPGIWALSQQSGGSVATHKTTCGLDILQLFIVGNAPLFWLAKTGSECFRMCSTSGLWHELTYLLIS